MNRNARTHNDIEGRFDDIVDRLADAVVARVLARLEGVADKVAAGSLVREAVDTVVAGNDTVAQGNDTPNDTVAKNDTVGLRNDTVVLKPWADPDAVAQKHDPMLIKAVVQAVPGLTPAARLVGLELGQRYNRKSGRCDPSIDGIVKRTGRCRATVIRAIKQLQVSGLFFKDRFGGYGHRNQYNPNWALMAQKLKEISAQEKVEKAANEQSHFVAQQYHQQCQNDTQTQKKDITTYNTRGHIAPTRQKTRRPVVDRNQPTLLMPMDGGKAARPNAHLIADEQAEQRLIADYCKTPNGSGVGATATVQASCIEPHGSGYRGRES